MATPTSTRIWRCRPSPIRERLNEVELVPFRAAIDAGIDAVMSAHITFPAVDPTPGLPSTLSPRVLTGLLRGELGFGGLIVTDALEMSGITSQFSIPDAAVKAVLAGADIVLVAQSKYNEDGKRAVERLVQRCETVLFLNSASTSRCGASQRQSSD